MQPKPVILPRYSLITTWDAPQPLFPHHAGIGARVNLAMTLFKFAPSNVLVTLFDESSIPVSAWLFIKAFPVKWATSDLDATSKNVLIDTLELSYSRMQIMRI